MTPEAPIIDAHNHVIPPETVAALEADVETWGVTVDRQPSGTWFRHREGYAYETPEEFWDPRAKLASLQGCGMAGAVLAVAPPMFFYNRPAQRTADLHRLTNEGMAALVRTAPDRFRAMATVPMQDVERAVGELEYAVTRLGMVGVEVGTAVNGRRLDEAEFAPFLEAVQRLGVVLMVHPAYVGATAGLERFYMTNTVGNPLETAVVGARFICGGVLDRYPNLTVYLVHGGGYLPYQAGRLDRAALVRPEIGELRAAPTDYLRRFLYDTITFDSAALAFLIERVGADRVLLGSDAPFDMRDPDPIGTLRRACGDDISAFQAVARVAATRFLQGNQA